jgi:tetratricopeptide (TPR) repeat protein
VILYELLVGVLPFELAAASRPSYDEIRRMIREDDPRRPSSRLTTLGDASAEVARRRGTDLRTLAGRLAGDLDWITMRALEKNRERRYESAAALADDIRRHLAHEPVVASPPSAAYVVGKFVRRNRALVAGVAAVAVVLVAGVIVSLSFALREARQRQLAEQRFDDVRELAATFLFEVDDSIAEIRGTTKARETIVSTGVTYLDSLAAQAGDDRSLLRDLADGYFKIARIQGVPGASNLGDRDSAGRSVARGFALLERLLEEEPNDPDALLLAVEGHMWRAKLALSDADSAGGIEQYERALQLRERIDELDLEWRVKEPRLDGVHASFASELGLLRRFDEASEHYDLAVSLLDPLLEEFPDDAALRDGLGGIVLHRAQDLANAGLFEEALEPARQAKQIFLEQVRDNPDRADSRNDLGHSRAILGRTLSALEHIDEGRQELAEAIRECEGLVAVEPFNAYAQTCLAVAHAWMAGGYFDSGESATALDHFEKRLTARRAILAMDPRSGIARRDTAHAMDDVGKALVKLGRTDEGLQYHLEAKDVIEEMAARDPDDVNAQRSVAVSYYYLGELYLQLGRVDEARRAFTTSRTVLQTLKEKGVLSPGDEPVIEMLTERIAACDG